MLKFMLVVINLIYFTAQLSYKFYACASVPLHQSTEVKATKTLKLGAGTLMHGSADSKFLSLDKRYDSKHIFALLPVIPGIDSLPMSNTDELCEYWEIFFNTSAPLPSQRGPPFV